MTHGVLNFSPLASADDGSCLILGCTTRTAATDPLPQLTMAVACEAGSPSPQPSLSLRRVPLQPGPPSGTCGSWFQLGHVAPFAKAAALLGMSKWCTGR